MRRNNRRSALVDSYLYMALTILAQVAHVNIIRHIQAKCRMCRFVVDGGCGGVAMIPNLDAVLR